MSSLIKKLSAALLIIFAVSLTGCLDSGSGVTTPVVKPPVTQPDTPVTPDGGVAEQPAYNPSGNKAPKITYFSATNIDSAYVQKGDVVEFEAAAFDPEGSNVTLIFEATGGTINQNGDKATWTAPNKSGVYQVKVKAKDTNGIETETKSISLRVEKPLSEGGIRFSTIQEVKKEGAPQRAIVSDTASTLDSVSLFVLSTTAADSNHSVAVQVFFTDDSTNHVVAVSPEVGTYVLAPIVDLTGGAYRADITYTAPTSTTNGQSDYNLVVTIFDPDDSSDEEIVTIPFVINTPPTISQVRFAGASKNVIALSSTDTIKVTATEANQAYGDTLSYGFSIISGTGTLDGGTTSVSNTTGEVEFGSTASQGQALVLVQVNDTKGGSAQSTFRIYIQNPMEVEVADTSAAAGTELEDYTKVTGDNAARYTIDKLLIGATDYAIPLGNDNAMGDLVINGGFGVGETANYYYTGASLERVGQTVLWTVYNANGDLIHAPNNDILAASATDQLGGFNLDPQISTTHILKGGTKTLRAEVTSGVETRYSEKTLRVNEPPYVQTITVTDSNDETVTIFNGTDVTNFQAGLSEVITLNISTYDEDNNIVDPDEIVMPIANYSGFVANQASAGAASTGLLFDINNITAVVDDHDLDYTNADVTEPTITYTADYTTSFNNIDVTIPATSTVDTASTYHYAYVHINDGEEQRVDIAATGAATDYYRVPIEIAPATATDVAARAIDIGILAGKTSYNKDLMLEFFDDAGTIKFRIKDLTTNAYWTESIGGDTIEITPPVADANYDGELSSAAAGVFDTPGAPVATDGIIDIDSSTTDYVLGVDYLAIDITDAGWAAGDKVYFKTYANNIVLTYQVVSGPRFSSVSAPKYATLGDTVDIDINGTAPTGKTATITAVLSGSSLGSLSDALAETDSDSVTGERWQYTAPDTAPAGTTVSIIFTITDEDERKTSTTVTITLNNPPTIDGVSPDGVSSANGEYWILGGTNSVTMFADVTDADSNDLYRSDWYSAYGNMSGGGVWNTSLLTATSGPSGDGQVPVTLAVRDFDINYEPKGGSDTKVITINVNEAPTTNGLQTDLTDLDSGATDFNASDEYPDAKIAVSFATGVNPDINDVNTGDEDNLNYLFYITNESDVQQLNVGDILIEDENVDGIIAKKMIWTPSAAVRGTTANYKIWTRVNDPKPGNAKGIYTDSNLITIIGDATAPVLNVADIADDAAGTVIIGQTVRFQFARNAANLGMRDTASAIINLVDFDGPTSAPMSILPGATAATDIFYYDYTMPRFAPGAGTDSAAAGAAVEIIATDYNGNSAAAAVVDATTINAIDNEIDLLSDAAAIAQTERRANNNAVTDLAPGTVLHIGDVLDLGFTATEDTSAAVPYVVGDTLLDASVLALGSAIPSTLVTDLGATNTVTWQLLAAAPVHPGEDGSNATPYVGVLTLGENSDTSQYDENTDVILTATITDDATNTYTYKYTLAEIIANTTATGIDLKRPTVQQVKLLSYYNGGGVVGNRALYSKDGTVYASNVNGVVVPAVPGTLLNIGATNDDADNTTMEVIMIQFDEAMLNTTLTDKSIRINNAGTGLDISTGSTSTTVSTGNNNFYYLASWDHDSNAATAAITNVLFIAVQNTADAAVHVVSGTNLEILFTDKQAGVTTSGDYIVTDANRNEIDYIGQDYSAPGHEYPQW